MAAALLTLPQSAQAHAKFFASDNSGFDWQQATNNSTLLVVGMAVAVAVAVRLVEPIINNPQSRRCLVRWLCEKFAPLSSGSSAVPVIARFALGATLILSSATGTLLSPQATTLPHSVGTLLGIQAVLGICLIVGFQIRSCALAVIGLLFVRGMTEGYGGMFERADILGLSLFVIATRGRAWRPRLTVTELQSAMVGSWLLRISCGTALFVTAFTEKLGSHNLTETVLAQHRQLDASRFLPIDQHTFIVGAAGIEILLAALIILLPIAQLTTLGIGAPFLATLPLFGMPELVGHMPIYGAVVVLFLLASNPQTATVVSQLIPTLSRVEGTTAGKPVIGSRYPWKPAVKSPAAPMPVNNVTAIPLPPFSGPQFSFISPFTQSQEARVS